MNRYRIAFCLLVVSALAFAYRPSAATSSFAATPLIDFTSGEKYRGLFPGFLYDGSNFAPSAHDSEGQARATLVAPIDGNGNPSPTGKVVFLALGMSSASMEWCGAGPTTNAALCTATSFMRQAAADTGINHTTLAIVNGCLSGKPTTQWLTPTAATYSTVRNTLSKGGLTEKQVQAIWFKNALHGENADLPSANADAYTLEGDLATVARTLRIRYPNLQQVFFTSRSYGAYGCTSNPEPEAYETGFAVKWLVKAQINQMANSGTVVDSRVGDLNYNTVAPWMAWGPYIWASGSTPRSDGLFWLRSDYLNDGCHPTATGVTKAADQFINFFKTSAYSASWFLAH
jgi:hypothetical protein